MSPKVFPDQGWKLALTTQIMVTVAGVLVIGRCALRYWRSKIAADDWTIVASMGVSIFLAVAIIKATEYGYGRHSSDLSKEQLRSALKWFFIAQAPYKAVICLNKTSVLLLYMRVFKSKPFTRICQCFLAFVVCWSVGTIFATIFQCSPVTRAFDKSLDATCINKGAFWISYAAFDVLTDIGMLILPIHEIYAMPLASKDRISLFFIFLIGGLVTLCSILRTPVVSRSVDDTTDITYDFIPRGIWTLVEANLGIICASLPVIKFPLRVQWQDGSPENQTPRIQEAQSSPFAERSTAHFSEGHVRLSERPTAHFAERHSRLSEQRTPRFAEWHNRFSERQNPRFTERHDRPWEHETPRLVEWRNPFPEHQNPRFEEPYTHHSQRQTPVFPDF